LAEFTDKTDFTELTEWTELTDLIRAAFLYVNYEHPANYVKLQLGLIITNKTNKDYEHVYKTKNKSHCQANVVLCVTDFGAVCGFWQGVCAAATGYADGK
jgi:hypothetical protein